MILSDKDLKHLSDISKISLQDFSVHNLQTMLNILESLKYIEVLADTEPFISPAHEDIEYSSFHQLREDTPMNLLDMDIQKLDSFYVPKIIVDPMDKDL